MADTRIRLPKGEAARRLLRRVSVYNPWYEKIGPTDPMVSVNSSDKGGAYYPVLYYACCIIAGNNWDVNEGRGGRKDKPFISTTLQFDNASPITIPPDDIIPAGRYYFHDPKYPNGNYPVTPNFDHWVFPQTIPRRWRALNLPGEPQRLLSDDVPTEAAGPSSTTRMVLESDEHDHGDDSESDNDDDDESIILPPLSPQSPPRALDYHDEACRVTGALVGLDLAHIVPRRETNWFAENHMRDWPDPSTLDANKALDAYCNLTPLRMDVHRFFDRNYLVLFPTPTPNSPNIYRLVTYALMPANASRLGQLEFLVRWHRQPLYSLYGIPREYLFARFAWSIFSNATMQLFSNKKIEYRIRLAQQVDGNGDEFDNVIDVKARDVPKIRSSDTAASQTTNTQSGRKRTASQMLQGTGWKHARFAKEEDDSDGSSVDSSNPVTYDNIFNFYDHNDRDGSDDDSDGSEISDEPPRKRSRSPKDSRTSRWMRAIVPHPTSRHDDEFSLGKSSSVPDLSASIPSVVSKGSSVGADTTSTHQCPINYTLPNNKDAKLAQDAIDSNKVLRSVNTSTLHDSVEDEHIVRLGNAS